MKILSKTKLKKNYVNFTPNGICIDGIGIEPDIEVELKNSSVDSQLEKALDILKNNGG